MILLAATCYADDTVTITTTDGTVLENVGYRVDRTYKIFTAITETGDKNISFSDISSIVDADGNDITTKLLGEVYQPRAETWPTEESGVVRFSEKKLWILGFGAGLNYSLPSGNYYEGLKEGVGFGGVVKIPVTSKLAVRFDVSKAGIKADENYLTFYSYDPDIVIVGQDLGFTAMRYVVEMETFYRQDRVTPGKSIWYLHTGLGAIYHKATLKLDYTQAGQPGIMTISEETGETKFIQTLGGGLMQLVTEQVGLDLGVNMDLVYAGSNGNGDLQYALIFDLRVGLVWLIK